MRLFTSAISTALFCLLLAPLASAQDARPGEIWVTLKGADYTKPYDGAEEWTEHEFEDNGFKLVIRIPDTTTARAFELRPSDDSLAPVTLETDPKKFKGVRVKGAKLPRLVFKATVTFRPKPKDEPPAPAPEQVD